ncbi:MAG: hypothetical protein KME60_13510 [Cyanomargarita calcarea GSE-NOS-MK-12-04C]|jgi:hypothetical protein|uniref:Uncharacterized protein n=1 Tax=Cyanomargarita calcarea GSE-NOS-MK-12-04C TaxID=2839659 RepID=A0A951QM63_9CYAN|nr:hypothetical protein [Cyanomargarita calcarea GSE-NOS-MK-12-04C]
MENSCPTTCPNRRRNGIHLRFSKRSIHLDPFEFLLWALLFLPVGATIQESWSGKVKFDESIRRIGVISALGTLIRTSPTEQIYNFLSKFNIGGAKE